MRQVAGGQNLGHLRFFFSTSLYSCHLVIPCLFLDIAILVQISMGSLFLHLMTPSLNDYWGKHCALITSVDEPS